MLQPHVQFSGLKLMVTAILLAATIVSSRAQTQYFWRGDAGLNGNWNASDRWWTNAAAPAGFGQLNFNNNAYLVGTNDSAFSTWRIYFDAAASQARTNGGVGQITFYDSSGSVPLIRNDSTATHILNMPMRIGNLSGDRRLEIIAANGDLTFGGQFTTEDNGPSGGERLLFVTNGTGRLVTMSGVITEAATRSAMRVQKEGSGTLILSGGSANTHTGGVTVNGGTLILNKSAGVNAIGSGALTIASGATVSASASGQFGSSFVNNFGTLNFNNNSQQMALGGSGTVNLGTATLTNTNTGDDTFSGQITGSGGSSLIKAGSGTLRLTGTSSSYTGPTTILGGLLAINGDGSLGTAPGTATASSIVLSNATLGFNGSTTLNANRGMTLNGGGTLNVFDGNTVTYNGIIAQSGTSNLDKAGGGTLVLGGNNSYSGSTTVGQGLLVAASANALGVSGGATTVSGGAALYLSNATSMTVNESFTISGDGIGGAGALRNIAGDNTISGNITLGSGARINSSTSGSLAIQGSISGGANVLYIGGSRNMNISGAISGTGATQDGTITSLYKDSPGVLTLSGNNSFSGDTRINGGNLTVASGGNLGDGTSDVYISAAATLTVNANATIASLREWGTTNGGTATIGSGATLTVSGNDWSGFMNSIGGAGNLVKSGTGTMNLYGTPGYTGTTTVSGGRLSTGVALGSSGVTVSGGTFEATAANILGDTATITVNGGTYSLGGDDTVGALSGAGGTLNLGTSRLTSTVASGSSSFNGVISGTGTTGGLTKSGSGTLVLAGNNTYAGTTVVSGGELRVNGDQTVANGALTVNAGATLSGSGTIGGVTTISGIHNPGNSPGVQSFNNNLTYASGSTVNWELASNTADLAARGTATGYDGVNLLGSANLTFSGPTSLNLIFNGSGSSVKWSDTFWGSNRSWLVYDLNTGVSSGTNNFTLTTQNWADSMTIGFNAVRPDAFFSIARTEQDIFLVYTVPEPSTWALLILGAGVLGRRLLKRKK